MTAPGNRCRHARHGDPGGRPHHPGRSGKSRSEGFTILEILVTMVLTAFGVLAFTGILKVIGNVEAEDTRATQALFCAQERMEELKFSFVTGEGSPTEGEEIVAEGAYQGMLREWVAEDSSLSSGLVEIRAGCAYPWKGSMKGVELSTLVFPEE